MAMRNEYLIEGFRVIWDERLSGEYSGWRCECWRTRLPDSGRIPTCWHTRYVSSQLFRHLAVEESGPKVVLLSDRRVVRSYRPLLA